ncbi:MAG: molybdopterin-guanine dinucleotide biosynthesis protein MobA [Bacillaceae bacterium]|uniref:MobQ family relaxase n=1 Tax=Aeribacillus TaxID=1055323 RepID=UPI0007B4C853|nr:MULTISPECIES: MobQ family relaxase [Aeribacillus]KZM52399.1 hypothetical protein A3Q35_04180 [Aeribacillus pallidus]MED0650885.1 MobQ family relaxase [Aeribacillus composti]MED4488369.1 MobQ family relaxase [Aeribacillus pallidus]REJ12090.1 MAG: molybdopterin-guanine dinucleotide biosynthesis protein MobA [Bacillaceae bacterium]
MAIYHFSVQIISRAKGRSAVAAAAYRSGERLKDERTGETKFYRREVQPETMILSPEHAPKWVYDRERLWNEVEKAEKRKDAQLAREMNVALPKELNHEQQRELIREFVQEHFVNQGMIADIAIHRDDPNNPHAHIMLTMREIRENGFGKKNREWNQKELLEQWREQWAEYANRALEKAHIPERISHLSHEARGLEFLPTIHLGHEAHALEKRGIRTERGDINRERQAYNQMIIELNQYWEEKRALEQQRESSSYYTPAERAAIQTATKVVKGYVTLSSIYERREQIDRWEQRILNNESYMRWKEQAFTRAGEHLQKLYTLEVEMARNRSRMKEMNWFNPFKYKENKGLKEQLEKKIERLEKQHQFHQKKLDDYREKLGFSTQKEFVQRHQEFDLEKQENTLTNARQRNEIQMQRKILDQAEQALKNGEIRQIAAQYPDMKGVHYLTYEDSMKLKALNEKAGRIVPLDEIRQEVQKRTTLIHRAQHRLNEIKQEQARLSSVENYLKKYEEAIQTVNRYEHNPFLKGKMLVSKQFKEEYEEAVSQRDQCKEMMKKLGVEDRNDFNQQTQQLERMETEKVKLKEHIQTMEQGPLFRLDFLQSILQGIKHAARMEERERQKELQKQRAIGRSKSKQRGFER